MRVLVEGGDITFQGGRDGGKVVGTVPAKNRVQELDVFVVTHYDANYVGGVITGQSHSHGTADWLDSS